MPQPIVSQHCAFANRSSAARAFHNALLEKAGGLGHYPFDPLTAKVLREVRRLNLEGSLEAPLGSEFLRTMAAFTKISESDIVRASADRACPYFCDALLITSAFALGEKGVDDQLRYLRWHYFAFYDDAMTLPRPGSAQNNAAVEGLAQHLVHLLWDRFLDRGFDPVEFSMCGSVEEATENRLTSRTGKFRSVVSALSSWLGLHVSESITPLGEQIHPQIQIHTDPEKAFKFCWVLKFPPGWNWPHRDDQWKIEFNAVPKP